MSDLPDIRSYCRHCGASNPRQIGQCDVCGLSVCTVCGNTQRRMGGKVVVHDACLGSIDDDGFSMIKFVK